MLAGFMYCVRVLFVENTLPAATRGEQTAEDIDRFLELRKKFLMVGSCSPCSFLIKMLGYGKTMSMQKINQPSIIREVFPPIFAKIGEVQRTSILLRRTRSKVWRL
jgi:hypothetical protein